jgi:hypothetical protein
MVAAAVLASGAVARAQTPPDDDKPGSPLAGSAAAPAQPPPLPEPQPHAQLAPTDPYVGTSLEAGSDMPPPTPPPKPKPPRPPDPPIAMPELLRSPTAWLLPAAVLYWKTSIDTGGGAASNVRVGLGDVAEFGVSTIDTVRASVDGTDASTKEILPYATATFRMGVAENRLFTNQPAVALGFEKSFARDHDGFETRTAELTLVASKHFGKHAAIHVGGAFWDASIFGNGEGSGYQGGDLLNTSLHQEGLGNQIVPFGGIQVEPIDRAEILVDLSWAPEFCYQTAACAAQGEKTIQLQPELSWGVRYRVTDWMNLESGVRLPNIGKADLLDAQIFGSVTLMTWGLSHLVRGL